MRYDEKYDFAEQRRKERKNGRELSNLPFLFSRDYIPVCRIPYPALINLL